MAALTFYACNAVHLLYDLTQVFVGSGFSFAKSYRYLQVKRQRYLFRENCLEAWRKYYIATAAATAAHATDTVVDAVRGNGDGGGGGDGGDILVQNNRVQSSWKVQGEALNRNTQCEGADTAFVVRERSATMLKRGSSGIDFAAIEASSEAFETQLRYEEQTTRLRADYDDDSFASNFDDIEVISATEFDSTFYDYVETRPVYRSKDIGTLYEGVSFTITGYIQLTCERFSINLIVDNERQDVALHINPRLPHNYIVRNTKVKDVWGGEEVSSPLPFSLKRGSKFAIQILVTDACYMISVNGHHFAEYSHRLPYQSVGCLEVKGDVEHVNMERAVVRSYPDRLPESQAKDIPVVDDFKETESDVASMPAEFKLIRSSANSLNELERVGLPLPYYGRMPAKSLTAGRCLRVDGRVKVLPHSFYVNLQRGQDMWPHAIIAFHFNPRFSKQGGCVGKHIVCRNAWLNGGWAEEERSELDTDFRPGKTFSLLIVSEAEAYEVYVNRKLITKFAYRMEPDIVDTVYIQGDIRLWNVMLVKKLPEARIYENPAYTSTDECD